MRLAAEVVTWLLLLRRVRAAGAKRVPTEAPKLPPPKASTASEASIAGARPGSISDKPSNRLVETGVPLKGGRGWQKRWTRMTREDELRQAAAVSERYEQVLKEARFLQRTVAEEMQATGDYTRLGVNKRLSEFSGQKHFPDINRTISV